MMSDLARAIADARTREPVASPCIDVCKLDPETGWCRGCLRTRDEIRAWKTMSDANKLETLDVLLTRIEQAAGHNAAASATSLPDNTLTSA
jgi:predicted Fe-S protein YdhL (DUF1289 family)